MTGPARQILHESYTRWWIGTLGVAFLTRLLGGPSWLVGVALSVGAVVEVVAVWRRKKAGDSLSEHLWQVTLDRPAAVPPVLGFGFWIVWTAADLFPATSSITAGAPYDVGLAVFAGSVLVWLMLHLAFRGRYG